MLAAENPIVDEFKFMVESLKAMSEAWVLGLWHVLAGDFVQNPRISNSGPGRDCNFSAKSELDYLF